MLKPPQPSMGNSDKKESKEIASAPQPRPYLPSKRVSQTLNHSYDDDLDQQFKINSNNISFQQEFKASPSPKKPLKFNHRSGSKDNIAPLSYPTKQYQSEFNDFPVKMSFKNFVQSSNDPLGASIPFQPSNQTQSFKLTPQKSGLINRIGEQQDRYLQKLRDDQNYEPSRQNKLPTFSSANIQSGKDQKGSGAFDQPI